MEVVIFEALSRPLELPRRKRPIIQQPKAVLYNIQYFLYKSNISIILYYMDNNMHASCKYLSEYFTEIINQPIITS